MKLVITQHAFPGNMLTSTFMEIQSPQDMTEQSKYIEKGNVGLAKWKRQDMYLKEDDFNMKVCNGLLGKGVKPWKIFAKYEYTGSH